MTEVETRSAELICEDPHIAILAQWIAPAELAARVQKVTVEASYVGDTKYTPPAVELRHIDDNGGHSYFLSLQTMETALSKYGTHHLGTVRFEDGYVAVRWIGEPGYVEASVVITTDDGDQQLPLLRVD